MIEVHINFDTLFIWYVLRRLKIEPISVNHDYETPLAPAPHINQYIKLIPNSAWGHNLHDNSGWLLIIQQFRFW